MRLDVNGNKDTFSRQMFFFKRTLLNVLARLSLRLSTLIKLLSVGSGSVYVPGGAVL